VTQALGRAQKIMSWIPDIGQLEIDFYLVIVFTTNCWQR
jgi:hypothetical protein